MGQHELIKLLKGYKIMETRIENMKLKLDIEDLSGQHEELRKRLKIDEAKKIALDISMAQLEELERTILEEFYIKGCGWKIVRQKTGYSENWLKELRARALMKLNLMLEGWI